MSAGLTPRSSAATVLTVSVIVVTGCALLFARYTGLGTFTALAGLCAWIVLVALAPRLPTLPYRLGQVSIGLLAFAVVVFPLRILLARGNVVGSVADTALQLAAVVFALVTFLLYFLCTYAVNVIRDQPCSDLQRLLPFTRLLVLAHALVVFALLARLYAQRNVLAAVGITIAVVTLALAAETFLTAALRLYQPARLRAAPAPAFGLSFILPALFGEASPVRSIAITLEKSFGVNLGDTWLIRLARSLAAPLILLCLAGLWACTAVTRVPVDSRGVLITQGEFGADTLPPGVHLHAPWPWARIAVVRTERVEEIALGFERDLAGPILWAEKHFEGEQNLLVGQGEELLTINVPIQYRVRDAVAFMRQTTNARAALEILGYRELLALAGTHTSFGLMTTDREAITTALRTRLQTASDRLDLGLEIVFVGLKDVHPPVAVASSYQEVVSAEEERSALVDLARTYAVNTLAAARVTASSIRITSEALATARRMRADGETARFLARLPTYNAHADILTTRMRLETLELALADLRALYVVPASVPRNLYLGTETVPAAALH